MASTPAASGDAFMSSLRRSEPVDLSGRRVFMTGGTGVLGKTLLDYMSESASVHGEHFRVTVLSRTPEDFLRRWPRYRSFGWLDFRKGSLEQFDGPAGAYTDVIHAAADTHNVIDRSQWIQQIVGGTQSTLEWSRSAGVRRFLLLSSGAIYGPQPAGQAQMNEQHPGAPSTTELSSVYGQAKRLAEQLCTIHHAAHSLDTVIARCFAVTGPHVPLDGPFAIGNFIRDALHNDTIRVRGDGRAVRTYLHGRDMAHWLVSLLVRGVAGEAYNVGSDRSVSMAELAAEVASVLAPGKPVVIENSLTTNESRSVYVPDIGKAGRLGLTVETPLADAIRLSV
jgi:UDP-glucuronate decarboxylase